MRIKHEDNILTLTNYKEPLMEVKDGFGYYGTLAVTVDGELAQCHICGKLFKDVGKHAEQAHNVKVRKYKEQFKLAYTTALISEAEREARKYRMLDYLKSLTPEERRINKERNIKRLKEALKKRKKGQPKLALESYNKRGTCPQQLLAKIKEVEKKLGHVPTLAEFIDVTGGQRYKHLIFKVYGSWKNAVKLATNKTDFTPKNSGNTRFRYTDDELLSALKDFWEQNKKLPTATDCKRGLLPSENTYTRRFGSLVKARKLAKVVNN